MREITLGNVHKILSTIGCKGYLSKKGQGWSRVYIHWTEHGDGDVPMYVGRVMFRDNVFQHVNWCIEPGDGHIQDTDKVYHNWVVVTHIHEPISDVLWKDLKRKANELAMEDYRRRKFERDMVIEMRRMSGLKTKMRALSPPNPRKMLSTLVSEHIKKSMETT